MSSKFEAAVVANQPFSISPSADADDKTAFQIIRRLIRSGTIAKLPSSQVRMLLAIACYGEICDAGMSADDSAERMGQAVGNGRSITYISLRKLHRKKLIRWIKGRGSKTGKYELAMPPQDKIQVHASGVETGSPLARALKSTGADTCVRASGRPLARAPAPEDFESAPVDLRPLYKDRTGAHTRPCAEFAAAALTAAAPCTDRTDREDQNAAAAILEKAGISRKTIKKLLEDFPDTSPLIARAAFIESRNGNKPAGLLISLIKDPSGIGSAARERAEREMGIIAVSPSPAQMTAANNAREERRLKAQGKIGREQLAALSPDDLEAAKSLFLESTPPGLRQRQSEKLSRPLADIPDSICTRLAELFTAPAAQETPQ